MDGYLNWIESFQLQFITAMNRQTEATFAE